jgi:hypothetical protein
LGGLVQFKLWTAVAPQFIWRAPPRRFLVFVPNKANISQRQTSFTQNCIEHDRHDAILQAAAPTSAISKPTGIRNKLKSSRRSAALLSYSPLEYPRIALCVY